MSAPIVIFRLSNYEGRFAPGELLEGRVSIDADSELGRIELSVLWHTAGEGDLDSGIMHFEVISEASGRTSIQHEFAVQLPLLPHSHEGGVIAIRWVVRVRLGVLLGQDVVVDHPFTVGG